MADYNSDRTGSNIDLTLDKVDALDAKVQPTGTGANVTGTLTADGLSVNTGSTFSVTGEFGGATNKIAMLNDDGGGRNQIDSTSTGGVAKKLDIATGGTKRLRIEDNGDISFYEDTGTTAKFVWDASTEKLRINTNVNGGDIQLRNQGYIGFSNSADTSNTRYIYANGAGLEFGTDAQTRLTINSSGNVGIGTNSPSEKLDVRGAVNGTHAIFTGQAGRGLVIGTENTLSNDDGVSYDAQTSSGKHLFKTNGAERARIDSSGNLLVGGTSAYASDATTLQGNGWVYSRRTSDKIMTLRRDGTDGDMLTFDKNGSTVGSIGTSGGQLNIGLNTTSGLNFGSSIIYPRGTGNTTQNGTIDLGNSGNRFKDLYLSGGVITSSDYRLKDDIQPMQSYADTVKQMNLVNFAWKESGEREDGFIAHELQALVPSAVRGEKDAVGEDGNEQYQGVDPLKLIPVLTKALQEALERIETLENK